MAFRVACLTLGALAVGDAFVVPLAAMQARGIVRSTTAGTRSSTTVGRRGGVSIAAVEEPWFDEAKANVLMDLDELERASDKSLSSDKPKKSVGDLTSEDLKGKRVLVRCDLNVPLDGSTITDDTRIRASIPTVKFLVDKGAKARTTQSVLLSSHLGRPKDGPEDKFSLAPVSERLTKLLGKKVTMAPDCIGPEVASLVDGMKNGDVLLLENVRFYNEETKNDSDFAKKLAANADLFVNDAFGTAHRAHGSTEGVTKYLSPSVAGFLLQKELDYLQARSQTKHLKWGAVAEPKRPFAAVVGGSKVSSKIGVIDSMLNKVDMLVIGGGMVFTFLKARGLSVGSSLVEDDKLDLARELEKTAASKGVEIILPTDVVLADAFSADANTQVASVDAIPDGWMGLDNGPDSTSLIQSKLADCKTVIWNGPMGVFEYEAFAKVRVNLGQ
ncbi:unnamed protein product [Ectocarpus sp. 12 AP-2014]